MIIVHCDGSITGSFWAKMGERHTLPHAWAGWVARDSSDQLIHFHSMDLGEDARHSGNVAEHFSVGSALHWLATNGYRDHLVRVYTDSQLIVGHLSGKFHIHNEQLAVLARRTKAMERLLAGVTYHWVPREQNVEADFVSKCLQTKYGGRLPTREEFEERFGIGGRYEIGPTTGGVPGCVTTIVRVKMSKVAAICRAACSGEAPEATLAAPAASSPSASAAVPATSVTAPGVGPVNTTGGTSQNAV